jgi:hypothetical protein
MNAVPPAGVSLTGQSAAICSLLQRLGLMTVGAWSNF